MNAHSNQADSVDQGCVRPSEFETSFEAYVVEVCPESDTPCSQRNISETERLISLGLGTVLAVGGVTQGKWRGIGLMSIGAALMHRGVTGHCQGYQLLGINTASPSSPS